MASRDFGLCKYEFKQVNGKGRRFVAFQTPSAFVRATQYDTVNGMASGVLLPYYSAQAAGILGQMRFDSPEGASDLDRALALFDAYQFREIPIDDDGNEIAPDEGDEPDPTAPRPSASAS